MTSPRQLCFHGSCWLLAGVVALWGERCEAEESAPPVAFSGLTQTGGLETSLRFEADEVRTLLRAELTAAGVNITRADSETAAAPGPTLSGVVSEVECRKDEHLSCRIAVDFQLEIAPNVVVYRTRARDAAFAIEHEDAMAVARGMASHVLTSLLARPQFRLALASRVPAAERRLVTDPEDPLVRLTHWQSGPVVAGAAQSASSSPTPALKVEPPPTPAYALVLRWGGLIMNVVGNTLIATSMMRYDREHTTRDEFASLRTMNDLGWTFAVVGAGCIGAGFALTPRPPEVPDAAARSRTGTQGAMLRIGGSY